MLQLFRKNLAMLASISMFGMLSATELAVEGQTSLKRYADRLRMELNREPDQCMSPVQVTLLNDEFVYKERLDSIVNVQDTKQVFSYNDFGDILTKEVSVWKNDAWQPNSLQQNTYDEERFCKLTITYVYGDSGYVPSEAVYHKYFDEERNRIVSGYAKWNVEHQDWAFNWMYVSELDDLGREIAYTIYNAWDYDAWQPTAVQEHYEVAYLDDDVVETTKFLLKGGVYEPYEILRTRTDIEHHYTSMSEKLQYIDGAWYAVEYQEELREYYGQRQWEYMQTYYEHRLSYNRDGKWNEGTKKILRYDEKLNNIHAETYAWDVQNLRWKGLALEENTYKYFTDNGVETQITTRHLSLSDWNYTYNTWARGYLDEKDYDDHRQWIYSAAANWSAEMNDWVYSFKEKVDCLYDQQGRLTLSEQSSWNTETQEWEHPVLSSTYEYADDGVVTATQYEMWDSSLEQWLKGWKKLSKQDDNGKYTYEEEYKWDGSRQVFIPYRYYEAAYIYDDECRERYMISGYAQTYELELSEWSEELGWTFGKKTESAYSELYFLIKRVNYYWDLSTQEFYKSEELQQEYDAECNQIEYQYDRYAVNGNGNFDYHEKWSKRYDANNNLIESFTYDYSNSKSDYWVTSHKQYEYDLNTSALEVIGLASLGYLEDKPLSYKYQEFNHDGEETSHGECYFFYSDLNADTEGIEQTTIPMTLNVKDGRLTFSSASPADLTICSLDGKLMADAQQVHSYSLQLTAGVYVITVNGVSRKFSI